MAHARYKQLVDAFAADIRAGRLPPGTRLPTHRQLAAKEGLALVTATRVYAELEAMGLVSGEAGRGTFVRETALPPGLGIDQHAVAAGMVDLSFNYPSLPGQAELLRTALRQLASSGDLEALLRYQPHGGRQHERAAVARHLPCRGLTVDAEQVLIVNGAQHGLAVTVMALLQPGDVVAADALTYPGFKVLAEAHRLELASVPATSQGPDLDALERLCKSRRVRAVYTMPTLHNPLGWVMSARWRQQLVAIARRYGLLIIEDAAYAFLAEDAAAPLAALAPETTVYVSGLSKSVATGLRVGFVAAPAQWVPAIERAIRATTWNTPGVMTAIACGWLDDGTVTRLEAEKRRDAEIRQSMASRVLAGLQCVRHPSSYFLWLPLGEEVRADQIAMALMREHVSVSTAVPFATSVHVPHAIRLALGSVELDALQDALEKVKRVVGAYSY
ncbi:PLP-dependent aminotransferase family protein [Ralstonia pseudosolanacearum]|uniref:aminotransferase-like domain-containing protein n=1 Tax=Ralstonia pseudosolanacearum TaxID=1310165 RepID=UPI000DADFCEE|nr:PLP-dependent aminotransferase family protein [Ralstonia pseudosolanacearum]AZU57768.1 GntR family transcriptional regulator [Ralstonia solanacearum]MCK4137972.1 PLP-dependent aminotransferase family protein [Ralstonia pseudosolanacearum]RAA10563.1 PLP-dependent aminotransferase family protein [Ralstonia pseudosolanacearum]UQY82781.1 PLP-dependent aminotransferase family protein [Ralstonia pseudosolanacearum]